MAPVVGIGTFPVALVALVFVSNPLPGLVEMSVVLLGVYALVFWYVFVTFALAIWATFDRQSGIKSSPIAASAVAAAALT